MKRILLILILLSVAKVTYAQRISQEFTSVVITSVTLPTGSTNYVQVRSDLQPSDSRFHVSSGTVQGQFTVRDDPSVSPAKFQFDILNTGFGEFSGRMTGFPTGTSSEYFEFTARDLNDFDHGIRIVPNEGGVGVIKFMSEFNDTAQFSQHYHVFTSTVSGMDATNTNLYSPAVLKAVLNQSQKTGINVFEAALETTSGVYSEDKLFEIGHSSITISTTSFLSEDMTVSANIIMDQDDVELRLGVLGDIIQTFDGDSFNVVANAVTSTDDFEVTADVSKFISDVQLGTVNTDLHGINTPPTVRRMLTTEFAQSTENADSFLFDNTLTHTGTQSVGVTSVVGNRTTITASGSSDDTGSGGRIIYGNWLDVNDQTIAVTGTRTLYGQLTDVDFTGTVGGSVGSASFYGHSIAVDGNMGTTGTTNRFGVDVSISGTADAQFGVRSGASGATINWSFFNQAGEMFMGDDDEKSYWGTASDSTIEFDGNSLNIVANAVTSSDILDILGGAVDLFNGTDVGDGTDGQKFTIYRKAAEGDSRLDIYAKANRHWNMQSSNRWMEFAFNLIDFNSVNSGRGQFRFMNNGTIVAAFYPSLDADQGQVLWTTSDNSGNHMIFTNYNNRLLDHDHAERTNPVLYVHSDKSPDTDNTEWIGFSHDQTDAIINIGSGDLKIVPAAIGDVTLFEDTDVGNTTDGKAFFVHRKAAEGDSYVKIYSSQFLSSAPHLVASGSSPLVIGNEIDGTFQVGGDGTQSTLLASFNDMVFGWVRGATGSQAIIFEGQLSGGAQEYFRVQGHTSTAETIWSTDLKMQSDSISTFWGAGEDASITFDGNSLNLIANAVTATDDMLFTADSYTFNEGATNMDIPVNFMATTNSGLYTWMEDEDEFRFSDEIALDNGEELRFYDVGSSNYIGFKAPALTGDQIWTLPDSDGNEGDVLATNGSGLLSWNSNASEKVWTFASPTGASGTRYYGGYYNFGTSDNDFNPSITHGTVNSSYAAHFFLVQAAGASGGTDTVIRVTGTSIDDQGNRTTSDTQDLTVDDAGVAGTYYETSKKWLGQVTISVQSGPDLLCNYGFVKYWDNNNSLFKIVGVEATWVGGANDSSANIVLRHHNPTGWTYNNGSAPTPPTAVADMNTDHNTEIDIVNGENGAWKRDNLSMNIDGSNGEGTILEIITSANKAFEIGNILLRIVPQ